LSGLSMVSSLSDNFTPLFRQQSPGRVLPKIFYKQSRVHIRSTRFTSLDQIVISNAWRRKSNK
jgi:hypothetical protein